MNKARRKRLEEIRGKIEELRDELETVKDEEEAAKDNMPESLWETEKYEKMDDAVSDMELAIDSLDDVMSYLESVCE